MPHTAELIAVGTELLGNITDTDKERYGRTAVPFFYMFSQNYKIFSGD